MNRVEELVEMKNELEDLKIKKAKLQGKIEELEEFFKSELGEVGEEEIDKIINGMEKELDNDIKEFDKGFMELRNNINN